MKSNKTERSRAMEAIYRANRDIICAYVVSNGGTETEATDLFQDSMITFYDHVKTGKIKGDSAISAYLFSLAKSKWLYRMNKNGIDPVELEAPVSTEIQLPDVAPKMDEERSAQVRELISLLGFECKYILIESLYHNRPLDEIASEGNFASEQIVRTKKFECLKKLREFLEARPALLKTIESDERRI